MCGRCPCEGFEGLYFVCELLEMQCTFTLGRKYQEFEFCSIIIDHSGDVNQSSLHSIKRKSLCFWENSTTNRIAPSCAFHHGTMLPLLMKVPFFPSVAATTISIAPSCGSREPLLLLRFVAQYPGVVTTTVIFSSFNLFR